MKGSVLRFLALAGVLFLLQACASTMDTSTTTPSGPPVAGERKSDDSAFTPGMGPQGASGAVHF